MPITSWIYSFPTRAVALGCALAALASADGPVWAANPVSVDDARQTLEARRQQLDQAKERSKTLQSDMAEIKQEREKLTLRLQETAASIQGSEGRLSEGEAKLADLEKLEKGLRANLATNSDRIAKLMVALQRMGRNPPPVLYTQRADALQMVRSAMLLASAFPNLRRDALELSAKLQELIDVTAGIRQERDDAKAEAARLSDLRLRLAGLMETKKQALAERQGELETVRASAAELSKKVTDLAELITKLDATVRSDTQLGAYEAELRAKAAETPQVEGAPVVAGSATQATISLVVPKPAATTARPTTVATLVTPPPSMKPSVVELAPASMQMGMAGAGRLKPAIAFQDARSRLPAPAQGRHVLAFGDKTQYGGQSKGIVIETRQGGQVTSPCDGWIVYAGEFRSYGQLLIINAGGGYHVLLAGLSQIDVQPGQFVLAAEPVGVMGGSASTPAQVKATSNTPVLYVEFRKDGRPIDPDPWWVGGQKKVQG